MRSNALEERLRSELERLGFVFEGLSRRGAHASLFYAVQDVSEVATSTAPEEFLDSDDIERWLQVSLGAQLRKRATQSLRALGHATVDRVLELASEAENRIRRPRAAEALLANSLDP